jgi:hypothetical protein
MAVLSGLTDVLLFAIITGFAVACGRLAIGPTLLLFLPAVRCR